MNMFVSGRRVDDFDTMSQSQCMTSVCPLLCHDAIMLVSHIVIIESFKQLKVMLK